MSGRGLTEQLVSGRGRAEQMVSGRGRTEQLVSGRGRAEQLMSGRGRTEQLVSGRGRTEQLVSGGGRSDRFVTGVGTELSGRCFPGKDAAIGAIGGTCLQTVLLNGTLNDPNQAGGMVTSSLSSVTAVGKVRLPRPSGAARSRWALTSEQKRCLFIDQYTQFHHSRA